MSIIPFDKKYAKDYIDFVTSIYAENDDKVNLLGYDQDFLDIPSSYVSGQFWLAVKQGNIVGSIAVMPIDDEVIEFKRFFVSPNERGNGTSNLLFECAIGYASTKRFKQIVFWTDARYKRAQKFFCKYGFKVSGKTVIKDGDFSYNMVKYSYLLEPIF